MPPVGNKLHEIPYALAERRGAVQTRLLESLIAGWHSVAEVDFERARREIELQLPPLDAATACDSRSSTTNE